MIHIEITNFQSISNIKLDFEGFTTIVGRNFIGKSATLRAINAALTNKSGTDFIRWGESFCEVHIVMEGYDILWHKEEGNNFYVINGEKYDKIGRDEPPALIREAGFSVIKLGSEKVNLNYAQQFFPLFLVDRQDTKGADLLTSVYGLDVLYKAVDLCSKEQKINKDDLRLRRKDLQFIEKELEKFEGFEDALKKGGALRSKSKKFIEDQSEINYLSKLASDIKRIYVDCNRLKKVSDIDIPGTDNIDTEVDSLEYLKQSLIKISKLKGQVESLEKIKSVVVSEKEDLEDKISDIRDLKNSFKKIVSLKEDLKRYEILGNIEIPDISVGTDEIKYLNSKKGVITELSNGIKSLKSEISEIDKKSEEVEAELNSFDVCPLCGSNNG